MFQAISVVKYNELADVAQRIEQSRPKGEVVSSILTIGTFLIILILICQLYVKHTLPRECILLRL